jgi:hypothetical protein
MEIQGGNGMKNQVVRDVIPGVLLAALREVLAQRLAGKETKEIISEVIDAVMDFVSLILLRPKITSREISRRNKYIQEALKGCVEDFRKEGE